MSRRLLHIIDSLGRTGTAQQLLRLAQGLARDDFDVHVCALDQRAPLLPEFAAAGIPATVIARRWSLDPLADWQLQRHVARLRPDIVHTWNSGAGMFAPITASVGRPIWSVGSKETDKIVRPTRPLLIAGLYRIERYRPAWDSFCERRFARHAARFVTNSPTVREWCVAHGLPAEKFAVIPSGVPPGATGLASAVSGGTGGASGTLLAPGATGSASVPSRDELLRELRLPADARLIGVVGRLVPERNVKDLIWAADLLRVLHDNLRMLIIGDGPLRSQLEQYARLASDLDHIQFLGERADVWRIMPHLDVLWNGRDNRGQSVAILEAMAAGVPVVASDVPINRELVVEGETGFLIPLGSRAGRAARARHTDRIFTDATLAARLAAASHHRLAEHFNVEQMVSEHVKLYLEFC